MTFPCSHPFTYCLWDIPIQQQQQRRRRRRHQQQQQQKQQQQQQQIGFISQFISKRVDQYSVCVCVCV